jgi:hypothetical protein
MITINAITGELSVALTDDELAQRRADWKGPRETIYATGALWKYASSSAPRISAPAPIRGPRPNATSTWTSDPTGSPCLTRQPATSASSAAFARRGKPR